MAKIDNTINYNVRESLQYLPNCHKNRTKRSNADQEEPTATMAPLTLFQRNPRNVRCVHRYYNQ